EDLRTIAAPIDLLGVNYYQPNVVRHDPDSAFLQASNVYPQDEQVTQMGWIVRPAGLREMLLRIGNEYPVARLAITENGAAYPDNTGGGRVADPERTRYLAEHVQAAAAAL